MTPEPVLQAEKEITIPTNSISTSEFSRIIEAVLQVKDHEFQSSLNDIEDELT